MVGPTLGIDFGTTQSSAVVVLPDQRIRTVTDPISGYPSIPSALCAGKDGGYAVGAAALRKRMLNPFGFVDHFKREFAEAPNQTITIAPPPRSTSVVPSVLVQQVLEFLRVQAEVFAAPPWSAVELCAPASWETAPRAALRAAAIAAGFPADAVDVTLEPAAAARRALTDDPAHAGDVILVYDLGGGTFDAAVVRVADHGDFEILAYDGIRDFGGLDIDNMVVELLREQANGKLDPILDPDSAAADPKTKAKLLTAYETARACKHALSNEAIAEAELELMSGSIHLSLSRGELEESAEPEILRTVTVCQRLLERAQVKPSDVARVVTVGGVSRMPMIPRLLRERFDRPVVQSSEPELAISRGAAAIASARARAPKSDAAARERARHGGGWAAPESVHIDAEFVHGCFFLAELLWERSRAAEAERWYKVAARADHTRSFYQLGWLERTRGNREAAVAWWEEAARARDCEARFHLAELLWEMDLSTKAEPYYEEAAREGHLGAAYQLGWLHKYRDDRPQAVKYWRQASEAGHVDAAFHLGELLWDMNQPDAAEPAFMQAAEQGHAHAAYQLGMIYRAREDHEKERQFLELADELGDPDARAAIHSASSSAGGDEVPATSPPPSGS
jgi:TPR repeat protein/actin-like ATPase involved in cell morphogenesis